MSRNEDNRSTPRASFKDLEQFAGKAGRPRPGRAVGGVLRGFYLKHPGRVVLVQGGHINGSRPASAAKKTRRTPRDLDPALQLPKGCPSCESINQFYKDDYICTSCRDAT